MENLERRESKEDLANAKAHLTEMLDQLSLIREFDEEKNSRALEIKKDLVKIESSMELKQEIKRVQDLYTEASKIVLRRKEDQDELNRILREIGEIESNLK